jgi:peptidyl-prolyl cis-trans isomerase A (cyclophilin A)
MKRWFVLAALALAGCTQTNNSPYSSATSAPLASATPAPVAAVSSTPSPTASATPTATPTPDPAEKKGKGQLEPLPLVEGDPLEVKFEGKLRKATFLEYGPQGVRVRWKESDKGKKETWVPASTIWCERIPKLTRVIKAKFVTTKGDLIIEIYPEAAPNAARRFVELIRLGYYNNTPIFRVVPDFVAQFGINDNPKLDKWMDNQFKDDPTYFKLEPGTLAFAKAGPDTNSTQVFINYGDNSNLAYNGNFTAFAKIVKGYENTTKFISLGDNVDQGALRKNAKAYLKTFEDQPDFIKKAVILP